MNEPQDQPTESADQAEKTEPQAVRLTLYWTAMSRAHEDVYITSKLGDTFQGFAVTQAYLEVVEKHAAANNTRDLALSILVCLIVMLTGDYPSEIEKLSTAVLTVSGCLIVRTAVDRFLLGLARTKLQAALAAKTKT